MRVTVREDNACRSAAEQLSLAGWLRGGKAPGAAAAGADMLQIPGVDRVCLRDDVGLRG